MKSEKHDRKYISQFVAKINSEHLEGIVDLEYSPDWDIQFYVLDLNLTTGCYLFRHQLLRPENGTKTLNCPYYWDVPKVKQ